MRYIDILEEAQQALENENRQIAIELIKTRLKEIQQAEKVLGKMKSQLNNMLEKEIG